MDKEKINRWLKVILVFLFLGLMVFLIGKSYEKDKLDRQEYERGVFLNGTILGYQQAIIDIFTEVSQCKQLTLKGDNQTISIVSLECLNLGGNT